jgi:hypothetical protein
MSPGRGDRKSLCYKALTAAQELPIKAPFNPNPENRGLQMRNPFMRHRVRREAHEGLDRK